MEKTDGPKKVNWQRPCGFVVWELVVNHGRNIIRSVQLRTKRPRIGKPNEQFVEEDGMSRKTCKKVASLGPVAKAAQHVLFCGRGGPCVWDLQRRAVAGKPRNQNKHALKVGHVRPRVARDSSCWRKTSSVFEDIIGEPRGQTKTIWSYFASCANPRVALWATSMKAGTIARCSFPWSIQNCAKVQIWHENLRQLDP